MKKEKESICYVLINKVGVREQETVVLALVKLSVVKKPSYCSSLLKNMCIDFSLRITHVSAQNRSQLCKNVLNTKSHVPVCILYMYIDRNLSLYMLTLLFGIEL